MMPARARCQDTHFESRLPAMCFKLSPLVLDAMVGPLDGATRVRPKQCGQTGRPSRGQLRSRVCVHRVAIYCVNRSCAGNSQIMA